MIVRSTRSPSAPTRLHGCGQNWVWATLGVDGEVNTTSVSAETPNGHTVVNASHPLAVVNYFTPIYCSYQVQELFVQASGAKYNDTTGWYETPCDSVSAGSNVVVGLKSGGSIAITPNDYTVQYEDECILFVYGWYDEHDSYYNRQYITLGQQFANNHCVAYDIANNALGLADNLDDAPAPAAPAPPAEEDSSTTTEAPEAE